MEYVYKYIHPEYGFVYVGRTNNLEKRIKDHRNNKLDNIDRKYEKIIRNSYVLYTELKNKAEAIIVETLYINEHKPILNKSMNYKENTLNLKIKIENLNWKLYPTITESDNKIIDKLKEQRKKYEEEIEYLQNRVLDLVKKRNREIDLLRDRFPFTFKQVLWFFSNYKKLKINKKVLDNVIFNSSDMNFKIYLEDKSIFFINKDTNEKIDIWNIDNNIEDIIGLNMDDKYIFYINIPYGYLHNNLLCYFVKLQHKNSLKNVCRELNRIEGKDCTIEMYRKNTSIKFMGKNIYPLYFSTNGYTWICYEGEIDSYLGKAIYYNELKNVNIVEDDTMIDFKYYDHYEMIKGFMYDITNKSDYDRFLIKFMADYLDTFINNVDDSKYRYDYYSKEMLKEMCN